MLVLSRRKDERIRIGRDVVLTVVEINGFTGQVKLGFDAPESVEIWRDEIRNPRPSRGVGVGTAGPPAG